MNKKELLFQFSLVYATAEQLAKCVILGYGTISEHTDENVAELVEFAKCCEPFYLLMQNKRVPASNKTLLLVLDIAKGAKKCIENQSVFSGTEKTVIEISSGILIEQVKNLSIELDKYSK